MPMELLERVRRWASDSPEKIAYAETGSGRSISYRELADRIDATIAETAPKIGDGAVVMLRIANRIEYPLWFLALLARGAKTFPVSVELTPSEVDALAQRAGATHVVEEGFMKDLPLKGRAWRSAGEMWLSSSGTTGQPKIVRRSSASLDAVSRNTVEAIVFSRDDVVLACVPLTHSYGVEHGLLAPLWAGSSVRLCDGFDIGVVTRELAGGATVFPALPSIIEMLATVGDSSLQMPKLRTIYSAGGPLPIRVFEKFRDRFGLTVGQLYGMTEIGSVTFNSPSSRTFDPTSVGQPMRDVSIRIQGADEVAVRAPSMFDGYLDDSATLIDGHFPTGDLGRVDQQGNLTLTGRVRLLIDAGGMKVNPIEVESVLAAHPQVLQCVVVPVNQSETVKRLRAVIVPRDVASPPSGEEIRQFARSRLAGYKVPRVVEFRDSLPLSSTGKVLRHLVESS
jgi:acyl-CoA synthetase (AMP-forming)/AMP-acid ligase II